MSGQHGLRKGRGCVIYAMAFEEDDLFDQYVAIRRWDDLAKKTQEPLPGLSHYKQLMIEHLSMQNN